MAGTTIELTCRSCKQSFETSGYGKPIDCPACGAQLSSLVQLDQLLDQWFYPRRWRADLHEPNPYYLLEKLWTANGQGERLYQGISPAYANYDVFRNLVTRLVAQGIEEGWVDLEFPDDPLDENPIYKLKFSDPDRFAKGVEGLFPEVDWDEQIEVPVDVENPLELITASAPAGDEPTPISAARRRRRRS